MASSKVMSSTSPANSDLPRESSSIRTLTSAAGLFQSDRSRSFGSMNMDDYELFRNIYNDPEDLPNAGADDGGGSELAVDSVSGVSMPKRGGGVKTTDEVWDEIMAGGVERRSTPITLEDFLTKAAAETEEDVGIPVSAIPQPPHSFGPESMLAGAHFSVGPVHMQPIQSVGVDPVAFNGRMVVVSSGGVSGSGGGVRGKRRAVEEEPLDKATQQKQRRMIKNRESAARSRERKQVHTTELEYLVRQLEEENVQLLMEEEEQSKLRYKQLMETLIPVEEKRKPPRGQALRRVNSLTW
ncbi:G-box-binding factor 4-like [Impatiens glandulifera]|uniref:G-box-binding factor 4-like n=1 Tax=Impatiens glandulifera TaxID=253017 RepID=UPI001FB0C244|nr:G-box-binding factor 4-like [Impatiens glandulifera]